MKVKDKELKEMVDVLNKDCIGKPCYWPRPDPGSFMQGRCGTRHAHGCPR